VGHPSEIMISTCAVCEGNDTDNLYISVDVVEEREMANAYSILIAKLE
jgi:hypothetical protein